MTEKVVQLKDHIYKKILTNKNILMLNLFVLIPLLYAIGLIWFSYYILKDMGEKTPFEYAVIYGFLLFLGFGLLYLIKRSEINAHNFLARKTLNIIEMRSDLMFDPRGPETVFIVIVPRKNWSKTMIEDASDAGFLRIDREQLLFEGGGERWVLNKKDIVKCNTARYAVGIISKHFLVIKIKDQKDQILERSFIARYGYGFFDKKKRKEKIKNINEKINQLKNGK